MVTCTKNIKTKKGLEFVEGKSYDYAIDKGVIRVYFSKFEFVAIKSESLFNKYFK
jgi:hypothetical protein